MSMILINTASNSFAYTNSDSVVDNSAATTEKAKVLSLESENEKLHKEVEKLSSENRSLQSQVSKFKSAVKVDISSMFKKTGDVERKLSQTTEEYLSKNNVNMASESANFIKQNVQFQSGSMLMSQANGSTIQAQRLLSS
ncbi:MAG: hypothetical protein CSA86_04155 [Arcobacter sp.]|nr:MAG: hypothetical protein CSA86_04155 [Arcobacter sp.]